MFYLADVAKILLVALALIGVSWWNADTRRTLLENTVLNAGALLGATGLEIAVTGLFFGWHFPLWVHAAMVIAIYALLPIGAPLREKPQIFKSQAQAALKGVLPLRGLDLVLALYLTFVCALTLVLCLAPPSGNDYDSLVYHLTAPARYLMDGRISELAYDHHSYFPFATEMLFALGLQAGGAVFAKLFHWMMLPLCCGILIAIGQRHFSIRVGLLMAVIFASLPLAASQATISYIDLALSAWVLLATLCFANWLSPPHQKSRDGRWLLWCGVMCGFALGTKYLGALFFIGFGVWALAAMIRDKQFRIKPLLAFGFSAIAIGGIWYIRNWMWTGNPVFPFAYEIFGGKGWTREMASAYTISQMEYGYGRSILDALWLPWRVAMAPLNGRQPFWPFSREMVAFGSGGTSGLFEVNVLEMAVSTFVGPILLAFGLPVIFIKGKPIVVGLALWTFLLFSIFWFATGQYLRYALPAFALLCIPCGWGAQKYLTRSTPLRACAGLCLALWCLFTLALLWNNARISWAVILGVETPRSYLTRTFSAYPISESISQNLPRESVIALYGEPRGFYLDRKYFLADSLHNRLIDETKIRSAKDWIAALRENGATHVLWNSVPERNGGVGAPPPQMAQAESQNLLRLVAESRGYRFYEIVVPKDGSAP